MRPAINRSNAVQGGIAGARAQAGIWLKSLRDPRLRGDDELAVVMSRGFYALLLAVMPAQAGIFLGSLRDPRLRGDDVHLYAGILLIGPNH